MPKSQKPSTGSPSKTRTQSLLAKARVEIGAALPGGGRGASDGLIDVSRKPNAAQRFFNTNDSCSLPGPDVSSVSMPEFNTNGSCLADASAEDIEKGLILVRALRDAMR